MSSDDQIEDNANLIHCWSGPRCVSTSLMYSFAQRKDTHSVLDEPLYAHYLRMSPSLPRPYRDLVMQQQASDGNAVLAKILEEIKQLDKQHPNSLIYLKHMAKNRAGINKELLKHGKHILLIRSPEAVISSFSEVLEPTLQETCYVALLELYSELRSMGKTPPVILSEDLVNAPEATLRALCSELNIEFDPGMLTWPAGPKPELDGCWAPWWYAGTHASTGFGSTKRESSENFKNKDNGGGDDDEGVTFHSIEPSLRPLLEECRPLYEFLRKKALRPLYIDSTPPLTSTTTAAAAAAVPSSGGTHAHSNDPRNENILIGIRDGVNNRFDLVWRPEAKVSVLDSGFMLGDGVWEGEKNNQERQQFFFKFGGNFY
jgi:protein-lysine N-methyltransferase EEF2KMT